MGLKVLPRLLEARLSIYISEILYKLTALAYILLVARGAEG